MKQVKVSGLVVYQGPDDAAREYAAGLVRQISDDPYTTDLAAQLARGDRTDLWIDWNTAVDVEDCTAETASTWTLAPTGVWQTALSQLEMIAQAVARYDTEDLPADEFVELVREQIGDLS